MYSCDYISCVDECVLFQVGGGVYVWMRCVCMIC